MRKYIGKHNVSRLYRYRTIMPEICEECGRPRKDCYIHNTDNYFRDVHSGFPMSYCECCETCGKKECECPKCCNDRCPNPTVRTGTLCNECCENDSSDSDGAVEA